MADNEKTDDDALFFHVTPKPDACDHDFQGWVEFTCEGGGGGGTTVCTKCGMDAMSYSLRMGI